MLQNDLQKSVFEAILTRCERFRMRRIPENQPNAQKPVQPYGRTGLTVEKPRRAREGRSPFDRAVPGSTCCRFSIRKAVQIYNVGTGRFLRRKIPFSREKSVSLQAPRPKNLRFLAETGEGGSGGGACFPADNHAIMLIRKA